MKWKLATLVLGLLVLILVFTHSRFKQGSEFQELDSPAVLTQITQLKQLVTVKYSIQRVIGIKEPKQPFGEESILLMVQGETLAGVDMASIRSADIITSGQRSLSITLPPAKLIAVYLDEKQTKIWDRHITWWTPWVSYDPDLEHRARVQALDDLREATLKLGILNQAQQNAETAIRDLLSVQKVKTQFKVRPLD